MFVAAYLTSFHTQIHTFTVREMPYMLENNNEETSLEAEKVLLTFRVKAETPAAHLLVSYVET